MLLIAFLVPALFCAGFISRRGRGVFFSVPAGLTGLVLLTVGARRIIIRASHNRSPVVAHVLREANDLARPKFLFIQ